MPKRIETYRPPWIQRKPENRPSSHARGYGSAAWQRVRLAVIARDAGACRACGKIIHEPGDCQIDHIVEKPQDEAAEATPLSGLQLLCRSCHAKKTVSRPSSGPAKS